MVLLKKDILWYKQLNHYNIMPLRDCFLINAKLHLLKPYALFGKEFTFMNIKSDVIIKNQYVIREVCL